MTDPRLYIGNFFAELSRRKVIRVAIAYGIVGFAVIEAADIIVGAIGLPPEFVAYVIVAIFLSFPVAIVLAWAYEVVPDPGQSAPTADTRADDRWPAARVLVGAAILVIAGIAAYEFRSQESPEPPLGIQYIDSVAVMPLDNLTGDPNLDHIGVGITEEIITHLARIPPLKVISRHSVQAASRQQLTFPELGSVLNVRHIIEGSIRLDGDRLRVTVQHINAETDAHVWADNFRSPMDDVIGMQENIARYVTTKFVDTIPGLSMPSFGTHVDLGPGQEAYLTGKRWLGQRTSDSLARAIENFQEAIKVDPGYAPAYADLSSAFSLAIAYRYDVGGDAYTLAAQALAFADHAIALDPNLAAGYAARGYLGALIGHSAPAVAADFERAASLQPNAASIPSWRARSLAQLGRVDEAVSEAERAIQLDPLAPGRHIALAELSMQLGQYEQAIASAQIVTALEPKIFRGRAIEARALLLNGQADRCANQQLGPHRVLRASCLHAAGREDEALTIIDKTLDEIRGRRNRTDTATDVIVFEDLAVDYALRGDARNALFWSARSYAASPVGLEIRVLESALFDKVRKDPDFANSIAAIRADLYDRVSRDSLKFR